MNKRNLKLVNYGISGKRYKELCGFCEQYPEWKMELRVKTNTVGSTKYSDSPPPRGKNSDATSNLAIKRAELAQKCELIEKMAEQADPSLAKYIIMSVCYEVPFTHLLAYEEMPCSRAAFYDARKYFFYLLDKNKK